MHFFIQPGSYSIIPKVVEAILGFLYVSLPREPQDVPPHGDDDSREQT
jgi:hypothetical protein